MSESARPLLSLTVIMDKVDQQSTPLMVTDQQSPANEEEWQYHLSFMSPDDLVKLKAAIDLAVEANFDNRVMNKLTEDRKHKKN